MVGNYPDVPGHRIAYDRQDTQLLWLDAAAENILHVGTAGDLNSISDYSSTAPTGLPNLQGDSHYVALLLAEPYDLVGYHIQYTSGSGVGSISPQAMSWSANTTNGIDGTWATVVNPFTAVHTAWLPEQARTAIQPISVSGVVGLRTYWSVGTQRTLSLRALHLYGGPSLAGDRLQIWHPTLNQEVTGAFFDWGDVGRGTSADRQFRVKNSSASLSANSISLSITAQTDTSPSLAGQFSFKKASDPSFTASTSIDSLAPGAISEVVTVRRTTPSNAALSLWWPRMVCEAQSWT